MRRALEAMESAAEQTATGHTLLLFQQQYGRCCVRGLNAWN